MPTPTLADLIGRAYLYYLAILPAIGTPLLFTVFDADNGFINFLSFVLGIAAVSVYVGMVANYTPISTSIARNIFSFVDGPILALVIILLGGTFNLYDFAVYGVLIEIVGVFLGILLALPLAPLPKDERKNVRALVSLPFLGMLLLTYFWLKGTESLSMLGLLAFVGAVLQSAITYRQNIVSEKMRHNITPIAVVGLVAWVISFFTGLALSQ